jgi:ABC-type uncharacterized transport system involved in gliding motility auxiliary subunit
LLNRAVSQLNMGRFDLTEDGLYSVSDVSKEILGELQERVQVNVYMSSRDKMPTEWKSLEQDITDKLQELSIASNGMLQYAVTDPAEDPELAQHLEQKNILPFPVQTIAQEEIAVKNIYSALGISYLDKEEEIINHVVPQSLPNLEYEMISRIFRLMRDEPPHVAIYAPLEQIEPQLAQMLRQMGRPVPPDRDDYSVLEQALMQEKFQVTRTQITQQSPIPEDADLLVVVDPRELNERQLYEIGRRVAGGLNTIIAVQQHTFNYQPTRTANREMAIDVSVNDLNPNINNILENWGVTVDSDILMDESAGILSIQSEAEIGGMFRMPISTPVNLPVQIEVLQENLNQDLSITGQLSTILYLWGTGLVEDQTRLKELGLTSNVLMTSSDRSWTAPAPEGQISPTFFDTPPEFGPKMPLAVLLEGQFSDPYEGQDRPAWPQTPQDPNNPVPQPNMPDTPEVPLEPQPARLLITGCARMWSNNGIQVNTNGMFFLNSIDALTLGDQLINIRAKTMTERRIDEVEPGARTVSKILVTFLVPVLLAVYGILRFAWRRREADRYLTNLDKGAAA